MSRFVVAVLFGFILCSNLTSLFGQQQKSNRKKAPNPAFAEIVETPGLPRVLLLGDSISIGYTLEVREALKGKANVHRPASNCGPTTTGLANIDSWLGDRKWDVIHFNFGLHDLKYTMKGSAGLVDVNKEGASQQVPIEKYQKNLETLVTRLKKTGAQLIWCSTTPVPEGAKGRYPSDPPKYNLAAKEVMDRLDVKTNDLFSFALARLPDIQLKANVHFSKAGSKVLAKEVASKIQENLPE